MTAAIATALRETADRAEADLCAKRTLSTVAEGEMHARALRIAESVLASGSAPECDVAAFAAIRAEWIAARYAMRAAGNRAADARRVAECAEREWNEEVRGVADSLAEDLDAERALQEAATEKEANT
jgi:hypothetical protein